MYFKRVNCLACELYLSKYYIYMYIYNYFFMEVELVYNGFIF